MRILLCSCGGIGAWFLLRFQEEGHECDWFLIESEPRQNRILSGLVPPPLKEEPDFSAYDLILFDSTGNPEMASEASRQSPVLGDSELASKLEDDRLYGLEAMIESGIEVPPYETFTDPGEAKQFILENPKRYVFKPFVVAGQEQPPDTTYVSESAEDLIGIIDGLFAESKGSPFLLQEVVEGTEISTEGWFDGDHFHFLNHTLEEKKFMSGNFGPNTGCSGNLVWALDRPNKLCEQGILKLEPFLKEMGYRGMIDLNTIVSENHAYGLEFTPRFGYDASATLFALLDGDLAQFFLEIATAPDGGYVDHSPVPKIKSHWAASERLTIPPYPEEDADFDEELPIKGIDTDHCHTNCYLWDARLKDSKLMTVGVNGIVCCPIATAHTAEGAWSSLKKAAKKIKFANMQCRDDLEESTLKRLREVEAFGWLESY